MKVIVKESLGLEYVWDVISSCDQNGIHAIADNQDNEILFYDPKNKHYCTNKDLMNADYSIHDVFTDKSAREQVMKPTAGQIEEFATKWDALQEGTPGIIKTKNCSMIRFAANEATLSGGGMDDNVSEWYAERFPDDDLAVRINTKVTFQDVMDCIDYGSDIYDLLGTFDSTIRERLFAELAARTGIEYGKLYRKWLKNSAFDESFGSAVVYWKDRGAKPMILDNVHDLEGAFDAIRYILSHEPGDIADIDRIKIDSKVYDRNDIDDYLGYEHELDELDSMYSENIDNRDDWSASEDEVEIQWMIDDKELGIESGSTETVVIDLDLVDCFEELVYQVTNALEKEYGMPFDYDDEWILVDEVELIKRFGCSTLESESNGRTLDDSNDWSASEGEIEIMWTEDFPEFGIEAGNTDNFVVEYDDVAPDNEYDIENNGLYDEICRLIQEEYPGIEFSGYPFEVMNEREFWGDEATRHIYPYDESEIETDVVEGIPNWAAYYIEYGEGTGDMTEEDVKMVDDYLRKLDREGIHLIAPIEGTENEFNPHPAFGDACDTTDWSCESI